MKPHTPAARNRQDDLKQGLGEKSIHVYDLEQEAVDEPQCNGTSHPSPHQQSQGENRESNKSDITCNSCPMVRETLNGNTFKPETAETL